jgi:hypothetical protein
MQPIVTAAGPTSCLRSGSSLPCPVCYPTPPLPEASPFGNTQPLRHSISICEVTVVSGGSLELRDAKRHQTGTHQHRSTSRGEVKAFLFSLRGERIGKVEKRGLHV